MDRCSRLWEIDPYREARLGAADARSFERHLAACEACRAQWGRDERLAELARSLPDEGPTDLGLRRLRLRVLKDAATGIAPPAPRRALAGVATLVLVAGVGSAAWALVAHRAPASASQTTVAPTAPPVAASPQPIQPGDLRSTPPPEDFASTVLPAGVARWSRSRDRGVERVVLEDGVLHVHVRPQLGEERFLVTLPDGELEVRGTTFDVRVEGGATTRVLVDEGVVEVRVNGLPARRLEAGEAWSPAASPAIAARPVPTASSLRVAAGPSSEAASAYAAAIGLLGLGRNDEAAAAFHAFALSQPRAPQAEDASFLEAVALARMGRGDAAALAAEHHLASFPASFHRREAAILIARAAVHRGDCARARTVLATWTARNADPEAASTLKACGD